MKIFHSLDKLFVAVALAAGLSGCGEKHAEDDEHGHNARKTESASETAHHDNDAHADGGNHGAHEDHDEESHGVEFQEGKGLHLPDNASEMLGVKIVDVAEGGVSAPVNLALRVFKSGTDSMPALASGSISTDEAALLKAGQEVQISGRNEIKGSIRGIQNLSNAVGLAEIVVQLPGSSQFNSGSFLDATATVMTGADAVIVPRKALLETAEGQFIYVVNGDHLFRTSVKVGLKGSEMVEISEGLYSGDQVVLQPVMPLWLAELQSIRGGQSCTHGH